MIHNCPVCAVELKVRTLLLLKQAGFRSWPEIIREFCDGLVLSTVSDHALRCLVHDLIRDMAEIYRVQSGNPQFEVPRGIDAALSQPTRAGLLSVFRGAVASWIADDLRRQMDDLYSPAVRRVLQIIHAEYTDPRLSLAMIAAKLGWSASTISRRFRAETGFTLREYVSRYRLHRAAEMMRKRCKVEHVAAMVGFASKSGFIRGCRRLFGVPPRGLLAREAPAFGRR